MKILVTGGAGYAGTVLCGELLERGHRVTLLDNFLYGCESIFHLLRADRFAVVRRDIRDNLSDVVCGQDAVVHLAAISGFPACKANPAAAREINVGGTRNLVSALAPSQLLVYASTTSLYGECEGICTEDSPLSPVSLYGTTKQEAEQLAMQRENSVSLRLATLFGPSPKMRSDLLPNEFVWRAVHERSIVLFNSSARRTFLHVADAARAYAAVLEQASDTAGNIYNVGSLKLGVSKLEIAELIKEKTGCAIIDSSLEDPDARDFRLSFAKAEKLGVRAEVSLEQGIDELLRLYSVYNPNCHYRVT